MPRRTGAICREHVGPRTFLTYTFQKPQPTRWQNPRRPGEVAMHAQSAVLKKHSTSWTSWPSPRRPLRTASDAADLPAPSEPRPVALFCRLQRDTERPMDLLGSALGGRAVIPSSNVCARVRVRVHACIRIHRDETSVGDIRGTSPCPGPRLTGGLCSPAAFPHSRVTCFSKEGACARATADPALSIRGAGSWPCLGEGWQPGDMATPAFSSCWTSHHVKTRSLVP